MVLTASVASSITCPNLLSVMDPLDTEFRVKLEEVDVLKLTTLEADEENKCGEILVGSRGLFTFVCVLCMSSFRTLDSFGLHINSQHIKIEEDLDIVELSSLQVDILNVSSTEEESHSPNNKQVEMDFSTSCQDQKSPQISEDRDSDPTIEPGFEKLHSGRSLRNQTTIESGVKMEADPTSRTVQPQTMTCKYCDNNFVDIAEFGEHLSAHTGPNKYVCPFCTKTFKRKTNRTRHILTHTGERPHKCSYCPKTFAERGNMKMHERSHLGIKKYLCDYCDKTFVQSSERKAHQMTHTGEKPHQCEECGKRYARAYLLDEHMRSHTNTRDYKCSICGMAFFTVKLLRGHGIVHTKERPYRCKVCGQDFPRPKALRTHMQLHSTEKKYVCPVCGKAFAQFAGLYTHRKSHIDKPI